MPFDQPLGQAGRLLLRGFRPVLPAVLLAAALPAAFAIVQVTSMGSAALPVMFAFGLLGRRIARTEVPPQLTSRTTGAPLAAGG